MYHNNMILYLNKDPKLCAIALPDYHLKHHTFFIAQVLSAYLSDGKGYIKQPKTALQRYFDWIINSEENRKWLLLLFKEMLIEHQFRFNKEHISSRLLVDLEKAVAKSFKALSKKNNAFYQPPHALSLKYLIDDNGDYVMLRKNKTNKIKVSTLLTHRNFLETYLGAHRYTSRQEPNYSGMRSRLDVSYGTY